MNEQEIIKQVGALVQAAQGGDQNAAQQLQQIAQAAKNGDPQATQIMQIVQKMMTKKAQNGAKLEYIKRLNGMCPEGYEMQKYAVGGQLFSKCMKCGGKNEKKGNGGPVEQFKEARSKRKREGKSVTDSQPSQPAKKSK